MCKPVGLTKARELSKRMMYDRPNLRVEWTIPLPWKSKTTHPEAAVMGGGKGKPKFYYTPVKARQIVCEIYGKNMNPEEIFPWAVDMARQINGQCIVVTPKMLQTMLREEWLIEELNQNPYTMREILFKNMNNFAMDHAARTDFMWFGKYY